MDTGQPANPPAVEVGYEEGARILDAAARRKLGITGDEFTLRWDAGEYAGGDEDVDAQEVAFLLPLARPERAASPVTFVDDVLSGRARASDVYDYVDAWHDGDSNLELHTYLGLTWNEYRTWVEKPTALQAILTARAATRG